MSDYRTFWLQNATADKYYFSDPSLKHFLNNVTGLGFRKNYEVDTVGNTQKVLSETFELLDIQGDLIFYEDTRGGCYKAYSDFIDFAKQKPLSFYYSTPDKTKSFYCDVLFIEADKTEIKYEDSSLHVPITFHKITQWLDDNLEIYEFSNSNVGEGKYYELERDYSYAGTSLSDIVVNNNGTNDVGFVFEVEGHVQSPKFEVYQNNDLPYGVCELTGTFDYVKVNSIEDSESIQLEVETEHGTHSVPNPMSYQDLTHANGKSYATFIKLKVGTSHIVFSSGNIGDFTGKIKISIRNTYASV